MLMYQVINLKYSKKRHLNSYTFIFVIIKIVVVPEKLHHFSYKVLIQFVFIILSKEFII